ncbi:MAG: B12-binding domain-containing radical SAM protein [Candidatus Thiodiazotropha sp. (ex Lucinoma borealis)]|nr:B12-binding domain-containing radical SAM protein [Candidatus Thiodiazotropha sp. (ex Lucinoma borealis)]
MKIVLISPKGPLYRHKGGIFKKSLRYQPLTLTTLAALIPQELNATVELIDEGIQEIPNNLQADLIGMTVITGTARRSYELSRRFRDLGIQVVLGGPHVTLMPEEALQNADAICSGYSEETWPRLLYDFAAGSMQQHYRQDPQLDLDDHLPFPHRELFNSNNFLTQAVFEATRSCAHDCEFCVAPAAWGRKQWQRPVKWVIEDIRRVGKRKILFVDLNLVSDIHYAKQLFQALIPLNIQWYGLSTVIIGHDQELMELMARSGCKGLLLGLETISEAGLEEAGKRFNSSVNYKKLVGDLHQLGIAVQGCFVFGLDHDTPDVFDATVQMALDSAIDLPRFAVLTPFPGTPLFHRLETEGRILHRDWEQYDGQHVVFQPKQMTMQALAEGHEKAWKASYRWSHIARRLWRAGNMKPLALSANIGYRFYAHNLHRFYTCDIPMQTLLPTPGSLWQRNTVSLTTEQSKNRNVCGG